MATKDLRDKGDRVLEGTAITVMGVFLFIMSTQDMYSFLLMCLKFLGFLDVILRCRCVLTVLSPAWPYGRDGVT